MHLHHQARHGGRPASICGRSAFRWLAIAFSHDALMPFAGTNSRPLRAAAWPLHRPALLSLALLCSKGVTSKEQGIFCTSQLAPAWHRSSPAKLGSARGHPSPDDAIRPPRARFPDQCRDSNVMTTSVFGPRQMARVSALLRHPRLGSIKRRSAMQIKKHDRSHMVELRDGSAWRIWPGDIPKTLQWLPTTEIDVADIEDEICSHALVDRSNGSRVRVIRASVVCRRRPALPPRGLSGLPRL